ncbi:hypothetical protein G5714_007936 [Onychostoma macrolepis]|uniref:Uncharacterized protein n=1 Tax=Onychostoma macrolepis TaxID=369639 RepID=A0A7J6CWI2_9TELE|nr:hypothetical protein G5714_007936 [Onychostoma macrolepis]
MFSRVLIKREDDGNGSEGLGCTPVDRSYMKRVHVAQVWSELRPWTKAQEEHLDILVLSDLFLYSSSGGRQRKYLIFFQCRKAKLKLYSAWREALQDAANTTTAAKVMVYQKLHKQDGST